MQEMVVRGIYSGQLLHPSSDENQPSLNTFCPVRVFGTDVDEVRSTDVMRWGIAVDFCDG